VGVEGDPPPTPPRGGGDNLLGVRNRIIVGVVFAALYIATFGARTGWAAAIVSGLLGGIVFFLLLKEVDERRKRKRR
jgi:membrane associated rhomboid family serine protease